jgi:hypothetical protein
MACIATRAHILVLAIVLGGCSAGEIVQRLPSSTMPDLTQPDYRRIVADNLKTIFPNRDLLGEMEISGVRFVDHIKGAAWITCLRLDARGNPQAYAIFIQADKVIDWRSGIVIDQCHKESYTPFDVAPPANRKAAT